MEKQEPNFVQGIRVFRPREGAPTWIKLNLIINRQELFSWLSVQDSDEVRVDLKESKGEKLYLARNDWKATSTPNQTAPTRPPTALERHMDAPDVESAEEHASTPSGGDEIDYPPFTEEPNFDTDDGLDNLTPEEAEAMQ